MFLLDRDRYRIDGGFQVVLIGLLLTGCDSVRESAAHFWGSQAAEEIRRETFRVSGFSMAPTLRGRSQVLRCDRCDDQNAYPLNHGEVSQYAMVHEEVSGSRTRQAICPHCGGNLIRLGRILDADHVRLVKQAPGKQPPPEGSLSFQRGDVVAIRREGDHDMIKRIVGLPGDGVSLSGTEIRINSKSIRGVMTRTRIPPGLVVVHRDSSKINSRWRAQGDWFVYEHQNIYRGGMPAPIMDDYPSNRGLARKMFRASDVLFVAGKQEGAKSIEFAFFVKDKILTVRLQGKHIDKGKHIAGGARFQVRSDGETNLESHSHGSPDFPLDEQRPIAYRLPAGGALSELEVRREIFYRVRPHDDLSMYPMHLGEGEYFVLGDNVPISTDSRDFGPVHQNQILGCLARKRASDSGPAAFDSDMPGRLSKKNLAR